MAGLSERDVADLIDDDNDDDNDEYDAFDLGDNGFDDEDDDADAATSRRVPIQRRTSPARDPSGSPSVAQSAPAPRAPIIGSMPAPSMLNNRMPGLQLPPQSPAAVALGGVRGRQIAQSAPGERSFLGEPGNHQVLHEFSLRPRAGSRDAGNAGNAAARPRRTRPRVSFDESAVFEDLPEGAHETSDIEEEEHDMNDDDDDAEMAAQAALLDLGADQEGQRTGGSMDVFSAARSLTEQSASLRDKGPLMADAAQQQQQDATAEQLQQQETMQLDTAEDLDNADAFEQFEMEGLGGGKPA